MFHVLQVMLIYVWYCSSTGFTHIPCNSSNVNICLILFEYRVYSLHSNNIKHILTLLELHGTWVNPTLEQYQTYINITWITWNMSKPYTRTISVMLIYVCYCLSTGFTHVPCNSSNVNISLILFECRVYSCSM
jgi:hypothetical protein